MFVFPRRAKIPPMWKEVKFVKFVFAENTEAELFSSFLMKSLMYIKENQNYQEKAKDYVPWHS